MQTFLPADFIATSAGQQADTILRDCVHCGLCNATCPTYQLERNELDGPRGRIYLIKQMLEGQEVSELTRHHLDRCLVCQSCETTCPSGVNYHRLLDIGREELEQRVPRSPFARLQRALVRGVMSRRQITQPLFALGRLARPMLPARLRSHIPLLRTSIATRQESHARKVILVQGCVQPAMSPTTNQAAAAVLDALGIETVTIDAETCCGALSAHGGGKTRSLDQARRNIDAWWPAIESGAEAVLMTASGCSNFVQDYGDLLADDAVYAARAQRVAGLLKDISEFLDDEPLEALPIGERQRIAWHCPCTAQHGQSLDAPTRRVLTRLGFELPPVRDSHLCCGSAGSYSLFQPDMARALRTRKLEALQASDPAQIVTANIGCQVHLSAGTETPVVHWIELVARSLDATLQSG
ncbi:MAG: glycolate oxidase subunit GlcF [Halieaceae bacterium]|nr:glycolate oxidase subunit GlcF [Halieaceae bacterium]